MLNKVLVFIGETGSGKSTFQEEICKAFDKFVPLVTHTTRKKRDYEVDGKHYHFVSLNDFKNMNKKSAFIETAKYNADESIGGEVYYGLSKKELSDKMYYTKKIKMMNGQERELVENSIPVIVLTPSGFDEICEYLGRDRVFGVYVASNPLERLKKAVDRNPDLKEECIRRHHHDAKIFTNEVVNKMDKVIVNNYNEDSVKNAIEIILKEYSIIERGGNSVLKKMGVKFDAVEVKIIAEEGATLPTYETEGSAGMDVRAFIKEPITLNPFERMMIQTGLKVEIPIGYEIQVRPRSGLSINHGITVINAPGTIDSDYRGECGILLVNMSNEPYQINPGDKIAQFVLAKYERMNFVKTVELSETERGSGGFGHTGK